MAETKRIICLANSRKQSGRCIAGREYNTGRIGSWLRPVSSRPGREISEEERRYENGNRARILDIISIPISRQAPDRYHTEDHLIDNEYYWEKLDVAKWSTVKKCLSPIEGPLWVNRESTYHGINDKISVSEAAGLPSSLVLAAPEHLTIQVKYEEGYGEQGKRKVRAHCSISGFEYILAVTDPVIEETYLGFENGSYPVDDAVICVSLSEPYQGYTFKLVASVITAEMAP